MINYELMSPEEAMKLNQQLDYKQAAKAVEEIEEHFGPYFTPIDENKSFEEISALLDILFAADTVVRNNQKYI